MKKSLFQPCVTVSDDGSIDIDWSDSYVNTVLDDDETVVYAEPEGFPHSAGILDPLVAVGDGVDIGGGVPPAEQVAILRRLADYIEKQEGSGTMTEDVFMQKMLQIFPLAEYGEDNDGQIVIYTGLTQGADRSIVEMPDG